MFMTYFTINDSMNEMAAGSGQITKAVELCMNLTNDNFHSKSVK